MTRIRTAVAYAAGLALQRTWGETRRTGMPTSAANAGVPILNQQFPGETVRIVVEFAFNADLTQPPASWAWFDTTHDVQINDGKRIMATLGKQDAHSVASPAQVQFTLDNRANKYGKNPLSQYWPGVRRGVPVRVRAVFNNSDPGQSVTLFQGRASTFQPQFDGTGRYAVMAVTANGAFRALGQGNQPVFSTLRQYIPTTANLVAYWPMEDPSGVVQFSGGTPATPPMTFTTGVNAHSNSTAASSDSVPVFVSGTALAAMPSYMDNSAYQIRALVAWPVAGSALPNQTTVFRVFLNGSGITNFDIEYDTGGSLELIGFSGSGSIVFDSGAQAMGADGTTGIVAVSFAKSGANIAVKMSYQPIGAASPTYYTTTVTSQVVGRIDHIEIFPDGIANASVGIGHLAVQSQATDAIEWTQPLNAYDGEFCYDRMTRLLALAGYSAVTTITDGVTFPMRMGPQRIDSLLNLIRECEATDGGVLYDGHGDSLTYMSHGVMENLSAAFTVDATTQLMPPFAPIDDDQQLRNSWTYTQRSGASVTYTDSDPGDANSTVNVGVYPDSATVNVFGNNDAEVGTKTGGFGTKALLNLASWNVHRDTQDNYRIPAFQLAFHRNPELLSAFVGNLIFGLHRMDVTNLSTVYAQMPPWTSQNMIVGYTHYIDQFRWDVAVNVIPYEPWHVGVVAAASGDTGVNVLRCDTVGSSLAADAAAGASTLSVASTDKGLWTTVADDFPFQVKISGIPVTVTNITGASSPQTFTVDPTTVIKPLANGSDVRLWNPAVLAIGGVS